MQRHKQTINKCICRDTCMYINEKLFSIYDFKSNSFIQAEQLLYEGDIFYE